MSDRVDRNSGSRQINQEIERRGRDISKKQSQEFQSKLMTQSQKGAQAKQESLSKEVLDKMAEAENNAEAPEAQEEATQAAPDAETQAANLAKAKDSKQTNKKENTKESSKEKKTEQKNHKVALDIAVQSKQQQQKDSGEFGGQAGQGDFFQQAALMGVQAQQSQAVEAHQVEIPQEVVNQIVDQVYVGVNQAGESQFIIELKQGVLNGGRIQVSSQGKNIKLKFSGLDSDSQKAIQDASDSLKSRMASKGLNLAKLEL